MAFTKREVAADNPYVVFTALSDGTLKAVLTYYREKRGGDFEETVVTFTDLRVEEAACIGRSARIAVYQAKRKFDERADSAYKRITTPGSD